MRTLVRAVVGACVLCCSASADPPRLIDLGLPEGAIRGLATAISDNGRFVAGYYVLPTRQRAFRWSPEGGLEWYPGSERIQYVGGVSDDGLVAGSEGDVNSQRLFAWRSDGAVELGVAGPSCRAMAFNRDGSLVLAGYAGSSPLVWELGVGPRSVPRPAGALNLGGTWLSRDGRWFTGSVGLGLTARGVLWRVGDPGSGYIPSPPGWDVQDAVASDGDGPIWVSLLQGETSAVARMPRDGGAPLIFPVPGNHRISWGQTTTDGLLATARTVWREPVGVLCTPAGAFELIPFLTGRGVDLGDWDDLICGGISGDGSALAVSGAVRRSQAYRPTLIRISGLRRLCDADFDGDGALTAADLAAFADTFNGTPAPTGSHGADFDGDGFIDHFDWIAFIDAFETGCTP